MKLFIVRYIAELLKKANYEYDSATNSWCASIDELPGAYAQANSIEEARSELASVIEDYIYVSLYEQKNLPDFKDFLNVA